MYVKSLINFIMKKLLISAFIAILFVSCGNSSSSYKYEETPIDKIVKKVSSLPNYTIILSDMDYQESPEKFKHKYKIVFPPANNPDTLLVEESEWYDVSPIYFKKHENDLGMTLVTCKNFAASKKVSPAGYSNYVGNEKYGKWESNNSGGSFWSFYGKYAFMSSMFRMMSPVPRSYYNDYRRYDRRGATYYGSAGNGRTRYGTNSNGNNSSSNWARKPTSFKQKVRSKVTASAARAKKSRISSTSSTRRGSSSRRSYGGGFGK